MGERSGAVPLLAEVFRTYGFEGASLARISEGTGLGKGSIYNFFPGGKDEMAEAVLDEIDGWFRRAGVPPLRRRRCEAGRGRYVQGGRALLPVRPQGVPGGRVRARA
jgi:AcrR family transcriptional regulator